MSLFGRKNNENKGEDPDDKEDSYLYCPENLRKLFYIVITARDEDFKRAVSGKGIQITATPGTWDAEAQTTLRLMKIGNYDPYQVLSMFDLEGVKTLAFAYGLRIMDDKEEQLNEILLSLFGEKRPDSGYSTMLGMMRERNVAAQGERVET
jgi:hypothetical protein